MAKLRKILVPLDGSKNSFRALDKAIELAKHRGSFITGIFVIQDSPSEIAALREIISNSHRKKM